MSSQSGILKKNIKDMAFIIAVLCVFGWLGQALRDGADIN